MMVNKRSRTSFLSLSLMLALSAAVFFDQTAQFTEQMRGLFRSIDVYSIRRPFQALLLAAIGLYVFVMRLKHAKSSVEHDDYLLAVFAVFLVDLISFHYTDILLDFSIFGIALKKIALMVLIIVAIGKLFYRPKL